MNRIKRLAVIGMLFLVTVMVPVSLFTYFSSPQIVSAVEPIDALMADSVYHYSAFYSATMLGSALSSTVQSPVGAGKRTFMEGITIETSAACVFNIEMYGTNATTTAIAVTPLNSTTSSETRAYGPSNAGSGTVITKITLTAGDVRTVELPGVVLGSGTSGARNISVVPQCTSGTVNYTWKFAHQRKG